MTQFKDNKSLIIHFLKGSKRYFIGAVIFISLASLFDLINPKIVGMMVDSIIGNEPIGYSFLQNISIDYLRAHLEIVAIIIVIIAFIGALFRYLFNLLNTMGAEKFVENTRNQLFDHIQHLPFSWYVENATGDIIQRCTSDVETIKRFLSEQLTGMFRIIIMLILSLAFMASISIPLTIIAAIFVPIIVFYSLFFHKRIMITFEEADSEEGNLSSIAQENLTGVRVVRAFGKESYEREKFEKQNDIYTKAYMKLSVILSAFWATGDGISGLQVMLIVLIGAVFTVQGQITSGEYIAFISYNSLLIWPIRRLGRVISEMSRAGVSINRIRYIMNSEIEINEKNEKPSLHDDIHFEHVSFKYDENSPLILDDINFTIKKGTTIGILGGTGSGKSTLMYLLDRLYPLSEGDIKIGDKSIKDIDLNYLRENIGMVLQEPYLFSRTIKENIRITDHTLSQENIDEASHIASLDEAINHFKHGYNTFVGERGVTLSGGQKQRTAIAQMVIRQSPIMIFDDSLSAVDTETDAKIRNEIKKASKDSTVILISHRITTLMMSDNIIVLNKGKIVEQGKHEDLIKNEGIYKKICDIQHIGGEYE